MESQKQTCDDLSKCALDIIDMNLAKCEMSRVIDDQSIRELTCPHLTSSPKRVLRANSNSSADMNVKALHHFIYRQALRSLTIIFQRLFPKLSIHLSTLGVTILHDRVFDVKDGWAAHSRPVSSNRRD